MKSNNVSSCLEVAVTKMLPIGISLISLVLSTFNLYVDNLKSPDISFSIAPYISHAVDSNSRNEGFFIPLTVVNRGARPGSILSFDLTVTHLPTQKQTGYFAQYYAADDDFRLIGDYFSPMSLHGYSTESKTVIFYPPGIRTGIFFAEPGTYEFDVTATVANVRNDSRKTILQTFHVELTDEMVAGIQDDGKYPFPMKIEASP
jgi:hypothetical protein